MIAHQVGQHINFANQNALTIIHHECHQAPIIIARIIALKRDIHILIVSKYVLTNQHGKDIH